MSTDTPILAELLRDPGSIAARTHEDRGLRALGVASILSILVGGAVFGAAVGSFRGQLQLLFAALKVPLALFLTLAVATPAFHALAATFGRPVPFRTTASLVLAASARMALVLLACAPPLFLAIDLGVRYHEVALLAAAVFGLAGLAALGVILRGLGRGPGRHATVLAFLLVYFAAGTQSAWVFRPYLVRPRSAIVVVRASEGDALDSVRRSTRSAMGIYDRPSAESSMPTRGEEEP